MKNQQPDRSSCCADDDDLKALSVEDARERILQKVTPIDGYELLPLNSLLGRVLDESVISPVDVPSHRNAAMDGYAIRGSELSKGDDSVTFHCVGTVFAGHPFSGEIKPGECVQIMTGAPVPEVLDTVVMQEQAQASGQAITVTGDHKRGQNVRQAGEDMAKGSVVLSPGKKITAADLGVLASLGMAEVRVKRRPVVAFFSTGDELKSIGEPLGEGEIYDSNRYTLHGMLAESGVELLDMGVVRDDRDALREAFRTASEHADVVLTSGGVSVGEADYVKQILAELGEITFWKIKMKPGRPLTFGKLGKAQFVGLPGNPVAVMVAFYQFVLPALHKMSTGESYQPFLLTARSASSIKKRPGRTEFARGIYSTASDGKLEVVTTGQQGSGILTSMSQANCFIVLPTSQGEVSPGDEVTIQPFFSLS